MELNEINKSNVPYCQLVKLKTGWRCSVCGYFNRENVQRECAGKPVKTETIRLRKTTSATGCKGCQNKTPAENG